MRNLITTILSIGLIAFALFLAGKLNTGMGMDKGLDRNAELTASLALFEARVAWLEETIKEN